MGGVAGLDGVEQRPKRGWAELVVGARVGYR